MTTKIQAPPPPPPQASLKDAQPPHTTPASLQNQFLLPRNTPLSLPSSQPSFRHLLRAECSNRRLRLSSLVTVFGTAFSPPSNTTESSNDDGGSSSGDADNNEGQRVRRRQRGRYLAACTSEGMLLVWDLDRSAGMDKVDDREPVLRLAVCDGVLYDVRFISIPDNNHHHHNDETNNQKNGQKKKRTQPLLVTCGDDGIFLFSWSDILHRLSQNQDGDETTTTTTTASSRHRRRRGTTTVQPINILHPYPSHYGGGLLSKHKRRRTTKTTSTTEINRIAYDPILNRLYAAAGDLYGGYVWDLSGAAAGSSSSSSSSSSSPTVELMGTFGNGTARPPPPTSFSRRRRKRGRRDDGNENDTTLRGCKQQQQPQDRGRGHSDYLHAIATVPPLSLNPPLLPPPDANDNNNNKKDDDYYQRRHLVLTGGEDGRVGIWDGRDLTLLRTIEVRDVIVCGGGGEDTSVLAAEAADRFFTPRDSCHVSSIAVSPSGRWATIAGGIHRRSSSSSPHTTTTTNNSNNNNNNNNKHNDGVTGITTSHKKNHQGFLLSLHLPTLTVHSVTTTRETIHDVSYLHNDNNNNDDGGGGEAEANIHSNRIVTVGNEGVVSYWKDGDLTTTTGSGRGRVGRSWLTVPSAYSATVAGGWRGEGEEELGGRRAAVVAVGGVGRTVDCISLEWRTRFRLVF